MHFPSLKHSLKRMTMRNALADLTPICISQKEASF